MCDNEVIFFIGLEIDIMMWTPKLSWVIGIKIYQTNMDPGAKSIEGWRIAETG